MRKLWEAHIYRNLRTGGLEITQLYRTFLVDPGPRSFLSQV
jgi:hypothetical protein